MRKGHRRREDNASARGARPAGEAGIDSRHDANLALVDALGQLAKARGITSAQLALAWVLSRGPHVVAIPGTRRIERLAENVHAVDVTLHADELARLDALAPVGAAAGERYDVRGMASLDG